MSVSAATVLMPDAEPAWRLWRSLASNKAETIDSPSECRDRSKPVVVGLPATACRTLGFVLPAADPSLLPAMIEAQLERRGVTVIHEPSPNFAWHLLGQDAAHSIVSVDVLAHPFPDNLVVHHAANYTAALRLLSLPARELVLVEEQGLLVLAAGQQGRLWHSHVIGPVDLAPADLARELEIAKLSLESTEGLGPLRGVTLVGSRLAQLKADLKQHTAIGFETVAALEPNRALKLDAFQKLLPVGVYEAQAAKSRRSRLLVVGFVVALLYAAAFAAGWWHLNDLQKRADVLRADVNATDGPAADIRETAAHWKAMEPAIETLRYPMVQLSQITALMPPSGVLIKRFEAKPNEIELSGDARDAQTATQFLEDLKSNSKLNRFAWSMPVPSVKDRVAAFKIQGKIEGK